MHYDTLIGTAKPNISELPGGWEPLPAVIPNIVRQNKSLVNSAVRLTDSAIIISDVLQDFECERLIEFMNESPEIEPVSVQGLYKTEFTEVGSRRSTIWAPQLSKQLWNRLQDFFVTPETFDQHSPTDWWQGDVSRNRWKAIGISPMLRFMRYENGGQHYAHYDAGFIYPNDKYRSLKSVVIYLTTSPEGGATRFINDDQQHIPVWDRDHNDWVTPSSDQEVIARSPCIRGNVLVFNHRECHDVEQFTGINPRVIIRTDILYEAIK